MIYRLLLLTLISLPVLGDEAKCYMDGFGDDCVSIVNQSFSDPSESYQIIYYHGHQLNDKCGRKPIKCEGYCDSYYIERTAWYACASGAQTVVPAPSTNTPPTCTDDNYTYFSSGYESW